MSGYAITTLLVKELGTPISVGRVYNILYSMEITGLIKCVRKKPGRVYSLTERGQKIAENNPETIEEIESFLKKLLCQKYDLLIKPVQHFLISDKR
jgi:DNA-binding PadR family transcriptional regulator